MIWTYRLACCCSLRSETTCENQSWRQIRSATRTAVLATYGLLQTSVETLTEAICMYHMSSKRLSTCFSDMWTLLGWWTCEETRYSYQGRRSTAAMPMLYYCKYRIGPGFIAFWGTYLGPSRKEGWCVNEGLTWSIGGVPFTLLLSCCCCCYCTSSFTITASNTQTNVHWSRPHKLRVHEEGQLANNNYEVRIRVLGMI